MKEKLLNDLIQAMKKQDKETLSVLRMVKGAIQLEEINKKDKFEKANRTDLIEQNKREIEILNKYMPEQLSEEEVLKVINEAFDTIKPESSKDMGKIMGHVTPILKGKADMSFVSKTIKDRLM